MSGIVHFFALPKDEREWGVFFRQLNQFVGVVGESLTLHDSATIESRQATSFEDMLSRITDAGKATDQRFMPQVSSGNVQSIQSAVPLSSTGGATTADIAIASHTLQYGFGTVGYNSGSIVGLPSNTLHHIYADDPNYTGGAVTYLATTNPQTISASNGRYRVGSITTALSTTAGNITAATSANPIVITIVGHGWTTGNTVQFAGLPDDFGTNLNGQQKVIIVLTADTFSIAVDGAAYIPYTSGGTATRVSAPTTGGGGGGGGGGGPHGVIP